MKISEDQLERWAKAPSETEEGKCQNTISQITKAIRAKFGEKVSVILQGSYRNRTNIRLDSDVDIVVRYNDSYFSNVDALSPEDRQKWDDIPNAAYPFSKFKNDIQAILVDEFGSSYVERKNKCVRVNKNSYRVNADVVPCFLHKRFKTLYDIDVEGAGFITDSGIHITSFPEQHYENGVSKNKNTSQIYKPVVRILKNVRNDLLEANKIAEDAMPSFLLECLVWNVLPNTHFEKRTYAAATRAVLATIYNDMGELEKANNYAEVSDLQWLFKGSPHRTHNQARSFMQYAWDFIGYED